MPRDVADRLELPWPKEGQAAIAVEKVGAVGVEGAPARQSVPIASLTKVMTAYVILKDHPLKDGDDGPVIQVDERAAAEAHSLSESTAPVRQGQMHSQRKLLELMLLPSGNNVARLLARWDSGSQRKFTAKMNAAAARLGMAHTTYTGASGFESTTRSTAADQLTLAREAMKDPTLRATVALRSTKLPGHAEPVRNTNKLLERPGVIGLKTGSSTPAGGNLMWAAEIPDGKKHHVVYGVVLSQRVGTSPAEGNQAALAGSGRLLDALQERLPAALAANGDNEDGDRDGHNTGNGHKNEGGR
ncbi:MULTISPECIES: D-alanyl-D-alanine carboxypeptidase [unclassified Streptomyces]|uniref:D-alanyl-D-alanine carboxypeptidase family protein n=1 Tax=Streptomyces TaxID=1883 RepID=UPI00136FA2F9|nr:MULTISPECIES: D-alanyl-D-alanine carboxypeptidase [unclassified Streptomyces]NEA00879.1 D-alanyl-D-alanine carboxypeptidase [Streptomyces sp. SID10116]MYY80146.1 D-alanyl-D-alanine carboxypeptidase [Streptomyces sp. SID335]MYZ13340.1 D-alanyl-D-alanine carboxypeptidase [Streptomyces sp. SID337]NDZ85362.1 D-alanyl-D-alanine carboxypeptidase [Streptomyces sp. SID10115]NEB46528.1 D-alanyl-D-alanine carboxypeptidase [Streptomyces sp. SID339]